MEFTADLIDDRLWLGNLDAAENLQALRNLHITHIVSLIDNVHFEPITGISRLHIRVDDVETTDLLVIFEQCYIFIDRALSRNQENNLLIHCQAGVSRSATIACFWLMHRYKLSAKSAIERLRRARPTVRPNSSFAAQLFLFEQMNFQFDDEHPLYKEFQFECARTTYLDHDVETRGEEEKSRLRQEFSRRFVRFNDHQSKEIVENFRCRNCQRELFNNVDLFEHFAGQGLFDWFKKYAVSNENSSTNRSVCQNHLFTNLLDWLIEQIDVSTNPHGDSIKCPQCSTVIGKFHLNGQKCFCAAWLVPGVQFDEKQIERIKII